METINNMANAAAKAVWGESENAQEPRSGVQGNPAVGEPYDGGNMEPNNNNTTNTTNTHTDAAATGTSSGNNVNTDTGSATGAATETNKPNPATVKDSSVTTGDSTKAQNDTRDPSNPTTNPEKAEAAKNVDDTENGSRDTEPKGPGPKPVDEVAREHGGDAGAVGNGGSAGSGSGGAAAAGSGGSKGGDDNDDGPQSTSHGEGTGEKYVKTSGLKADGGDFDAAVPGAGREADRLMEEKGMHPNDAAHKDSSAPSSSEPAEPKHGHGHGHGGSTEETKEKKSLGEKIKAKLHKH